MKVFRELKIQGDPDQLTALGEAIAATSADGWTRDIGAEDSMKRLTRPVGHEAYAFMCLRLGHRPAATVFLIRKESDTFSVPNIIPHDQHQLSFDEYNTILEEFARTFVEPLASRFGAEVHISESEADLERWLSEETAEKLRHFSRVANKWSGSRHPADRNRWFEFLTAAHQEQAAFPADLLVRWLHEIGGWSPETANELAGEYEFARGLLTFADREAVGA